MTHRQLIPTLITLICSLGVGALLALRELFVLSFYLGQLALLVKKQVVREQDNQPQVHSTLREHCLSNKGVKLWNSCCNELKQATSIFQFKNIYKRITLEKYLLE